MGFLDKLISKLDDNDPNQHKPMDPPSSQYQGQPQYGPQAGYANAEYQQTGFGQDQHGAQGYVHPPPQGQGYAGGQHQGYAQEQGQGQGYGQVDRKSP
jgi:hypothetical protein